MKYLILLCISIVSTQALASKGNTFFEWRSEYMYENLDVKANEQVQEYETFTDKIFLKRYHELSCRLTVTTDKDSRKPIVKKRWECWTTKSDLGPTAAKFIYESIPILPQKLEDNFVKRYMDFKCWKSIHSLVYMCDKQTLPEIQYHYELAQKNPDGSYRLLNPKIIAFNRDLFPYNHRSKFPNAHDFTPTERFHNLCNHLGFDHPGVFGYQKSKTIHQSEGALYINGKYEFGTDRSSRNLRGIEELDCYNKADKEELFKFVKYESPLSNDFEMMIENPRLSIEGVSLPYKDVGTGYLSSRICQAFGYKRLLNNFVGTRKVRSDYYYPSKYTLGSTKIDLRSIIVRPQRTWGDTVKRFLCVNLEEDERYPLKETAVSMIAGNSDYLVIHNPDLLIGGHAVSLSYNFQRGYCRLFGLNFVETAYHSSGESTKGSYPAARLTEEGELKSVDKDNIFVTKIRCSRPEGQQADPIIKTILIEKDGASKKLIEYLESIGIQVHLEK